MNRITLAEKLGTTPHISSLLQKAEQFGLHSAELLEGLAVARGCWHYRHPDLVLPPNVSETEFGNEELAVALLSPCLPYSPHTIRVGGMMLGAEGNSVSRIVELTLLERSVVPVRHVALCGLKFEPQNSFWKQLLEGLPSVPMPDSGILLHPTRYVSMTGFTRNGPGLVVQWLRPCKETAA